MKLILVVLALVFGAWLWRRGRSGEPPRSGEAPLAPHPDSLPVQHMVACRHCGLHLPASDALQTAEGWYCNADHQHRHNPSTGSA